MTGQGWPCWQDRDGCDEEIPKLGLSGHNSAMTQHPQLGEPGYEINLTGSGV